MWQKSDTDLETGSVHMGKVIIDIKITEKREK